MTPTTDIADENISLLLDFLNTVDVEAGTDSLAGDPGARVIRDALREVIAGRGADLPAVRLDVVVTPLGLQVRGVDPASAAVAAAVTLSNRGDLSRIRLCARHDCEWAFYDRSRNGSRSWCTMAVCGNREKARTWRSTHSAN